METYLVKGKNRRIDGKFYRNVFTVSAASMSDAQAIVDAKAIDWEKPPTITLRDSKGGF